MLNLVTEHLLEVSWTQNTHGIELLRSFMEEVMLFLNPSKNHRPAKLSTIKKDALGIGRVPAAGNIPSSNFWEFSGLRWILMLSLS